MAKKLPTIFNIESISNFRDTESGRFALAFLNAVKGKTQSPFDGSEKSYRVNLANTETRVFIGKNGAYPSYYISELKQFDFSDWGIVPPFDADGKRVHGIYRLDADSGKKLDPLPDVPSSKLRTYLVDAGEVDELKDHELILVFSEYAKQFNPDFDLSGGLYEEFAVYVTVGHNDEIVSIDTEFEGYATECSLTEFLFSYFPKPVRELGYCFFRVKNSNLFFPNDSFLDKVVEPMRNVSLSGSKVPFVSVWPYGFGDVFGLVNSDRTGFHILKYGKEGTEWFNKYDPCRNGPFMTTTLEEFLDGLNLNSGNVSQKEIVYRRNGTRYELTDFEDECEVFDYLEDCLNGGIEMESYGLDILRIGFVDGKPTHLMKDKWFNSAGVTSMDIEEFYFSYVCKKPLLKEDEDPCVPNPLPTKEDLEDVSLYRTVLIRCNRHGLGTPLIHSEAYGRLRDFVSTFDTYSEFGDECVELYLRLDKSNTFKVHSVQANGLFQVDETYQDPVDFLTAYGLFGKKKLPEDFVLYHELDGDDSELCNSGINMIPFRYLRGISESSIVGAFKYYRFWKDSGSKTYLGCDWSDSLNRIWFELPRISVTDLHLYDLRSSQGNDEDSQSINDSTMSNNLLNEILVQQFFSDKSNQVAIATFISTYKDISSELKQSTRKIDKVTNVVDRDLAEMNDAIARNDIKKIEELLAEYKQSTEYVRNFGKNTVAALGEKEDVEEFDVSKKFNK